MISRELREQLRAETGLPAGSRKAKPQERYSEEEKKLALKIRSTYVESRSAWETNKRGVSYEYVPFKTDDKGKHSFADNKPVDKDPLWLRLAVQFVQLQIDPESYIRTVFDLCSSVKPPEPRHVLSQRYMKMFEKATLGDKFVKECKILLNTEKQLAASHISFWQANGMSFVDSHSFVLLNAGLSLSSLFRYCIAVQLYKKTKAKVFKKITKRYLLDAVVQFQPHHKHYVAVWGKLLPSRFIEEAPKLYSSVFKSEYVLNDDE
jgi:hypothetical protein